MEPILTVHRLRRRLQPALLSLLLAALPAAAEPLPVEYFTGDSTVSSLRLSPGGDFLAATASQNGVSTLLFFELAGMQAVGGVRARDGDLITRVNWVSSSRVVHSYAERYPGQDYPSETGEIFGIDRDGTAGTRLYGFRAGDARSGTRVRRRSSTSAVGELLSPLWDDETSILIIERPFKAMQGTLRFNADAHPRIARLDVRSGRKTMLDSIPLALAHVILDRQDRVRFAMGYEQDGTYTALWKAEPDGDWSRFSLPGFRDDSINAHRFAADDRGVLFTGIAEPA